MYVSIAAILFSFIASVLQLELIPSLSDVTLVTKGKDIGKVEKPLKIN